ncbi:hypothetical protein V2W45_1465742 [Cenococcum geophilum]
MAHLLIRKKLTPFLRHKRSESGFLTLLKTKGINKEGINKDSKLPNDLLFNNNIFNKTYNIIDSRNEAKALAIYNAKLKCLIKSLNKLLPFITIYYIYFPFLTYKVKCSTIQNAYSITLAVRAIVKLFRLVKCKKELYWQILAFLVSYNYQTGKDTTYYYHPIYTFNFTALNRKKKWTVYKFTKNLLKSGLLQKLKSYYLLQLFTELESLPGERDNTTPDTSFIEEETSKRLRRNARK